MALWCRPSALFQAAEFNAMPLARGKLARITVSCEVSCPAVGLAGPPGRLCSARRTRRRLMNTLSILVPGASQDDPVSVRDLDVTREMTAGEALEASGLDGYYLRTEDGAFLSPADKLSGFAEQKAKLFAVLRGEVGG